MDSRVECDCTSLNARSISLDGPLFKGGFASVSSLFFERNHEPKVNSSLDGFQARTIFS